MKDGYPYRHNLRSERWARDTPSEPSFPSSATTLPKCPETANTENKSAGASSGLTVAGFRHATQTALRTLTFKDSRDLLPDVSRLLKLTRTEVASGQLLRSSSGNNCRSWQARTAQQRFGPTRCNTASRQTTQSRSAVPQSFGKSTNLHRCVQRHVTEHRAGQGMRSVAS